MVASWEANVGKEGEGRVVATEQQIAEVRWPMEMATVVSLW